MGLRPRLEIKVHLLVEVNEPLGGGLAAFYHIGYALGYRFGGASAGSPLILQASQLGNGQMDMVDLVGDDLDLPEGVLVGVLFSGNLGCGNLGCGGLGRGVLGIVDLLVHGVILQIHIMIRRTRQ